MADKTLSLYKLVLYRDVRSNPPTINPNQSTGTSWDYPLLVIAPSWEKAAEVGEEWCVKNSNNYLTFKGVWMIRLEKEIQIATAE